MARTETVLAYFIMFWGGVHPGGWRLDDAPENPQMNFENIKKMVQKAEAAKIHTLFLADGLSVWPERTPEAASRTSNIIRFDPLTLSTALAGCTKKIGLALTMSTTYTEPWQAARYFASLDHLSGGRAGWNIVTGANRDDAALFGADSHMEHSVRYKRASEFYDLATEFWDTFEDDAFSFDKKTGQFFDTEKMHPVDHKGEIFSAQGALSLPRPIQGYPVIAQAGHSKDGLAFGTRVADLMFVLPAPDIEAGRAQYDKFKKLIVEAGRGVDDVVIMQSTTVVLGRTTAEAEDKLRQMNEALDPIVSLESLRFMLDFDLSVYPLDGPVPFDDIPLTTVGPQSMQKLVLDIARRDNLTIRQIADLTAGDFCSALSVDEMVEYIALNHGKTADGFCMNFADATGSADLFFSEVVPELQRRGIFQKEYAGDTLRENLGIPRPESRYAKTSTTTE